MPCAICACTDQCQFICICFLTHAARHIMANLRVVYIFVLAAAVGANAQTTAAPSTQCTYVTYLTSFSSPLDPTTLPSVNSTCIAAINAALAAASVSPTKFPDIKYYQSVCSSTCQSFFDLYSSCNGVLEAQIFIGQYCGIYNGSYCPVVYNTTKYQSDRNTVASSCTGTCTASCSSALTAINGYAGCCTASDTTILPTLTSLAFLNLECDTIYYPCPSVFGAAVTQGIGMLTVAFAAFLTVWL